MLKLATLIKNPGEPVTDTKYHSDQELRDLGYNGRAFFETTSLSGLIGPQELGDAEMRRWVQSTIDGVTRQINSAIAAGLDVYLFYDMLVLARETVAKNPRILTCKGRPNSLCPASDQTLQLSFDALDAMIKRWPQIKGIVLRFGDTDAQRMPHLMGNDIYLPHCPRCSQFGRADRIVEVLTRAHELVVNQHDKRLIARAWNVRPNGMHDTPELTRRVVERLPGDPADDRFVLSYKFTQTDFWRYQPWNQASLECGGRPILYELQCQREFEGKGGFPNWQVPLWLEGAPEVAEAEDAVGGLPDAMTKANVAGLFAWVRGGGWGGPFIKDETWVDANVYAVPRIANEPGLTADAVGQAWLRDRLGITDDAVAAVLLDILKHSPEVVRQAFYIAPFAKSKADAWHPAADWIQDDQFDARAAWRTLQRLRDSQLDELVEEKRAAADQLSRDYQALHDLVGDRHDAQLEPLLNALAYKLSFVEALRDLMAGLVAYRRHKKNPAPQLAEVARRRLLESQSYWNHHVQRNSSLPGSPTAFREVHFWELTQDLLAELG